MNTADAPLLTFLGVSWPVEHCSACRDQSVIRVSCFFGGATDLEAERHELAAQLPYRGTSRPSVTLSVITDILFRLYIGKGTFQFNRTYPHITFM